MKSSSFSSEHERHPEEGDYIINWHLSYITSLGTQGVSFLKTLSDQIKAEITKIQADAQFIESKLPGSHRHLKKLQKSECDLRILLDPLEEMRERLEKTARRAAQRVS
jgi:hypothetical protein